MDIAKAVAVAVRGLGLKSKRVRDSVQPASPEPGPRPMSPAEMRVQRANLGLLESAGGTLARTIALLK